jgi:hypothetical protein
VQRVWPPRSRALISRGLQQQFRRLDVTVWVNRVAQFLGIRARIGAASQH